MIFKSGYVAILGRPNVGKSSLLNVLVGRKVAIVTPKPQTTRGRILGIRHDKNAQIILIDTPGIHRERFEVNRYMNAAAFNAIPDADVIIFVIDAKKGLTREDKSILERIGKDKRKATKVIVAINKVDKVEKESILPLIGTFSKDYPFVSDVVPISATRNTNIDELLDAVVKLLPEGPKYFGESEVTDMPVKTYVAEAIREKAMLLTRNEIPHSIAVKVLNIENAKRQSDMLAIDAEIIVEKDSQKAIVIGKRGQRLKRIGQLSREDLQEAFNKKIYLTLWVKVRKNWRKNPKDLQELGYS
ncbi:MAG: GTPase Era [Nitrospiraceae bacterium]|nr:GTPase Era [Nitrospiraceae bacterium]